MDEDPSKQTASFARRTFIGTGIGLLSLVGLAGFAGGPGSVLYTRAQEAGWSTPLHALAVMETDDLVDALPLIERERTVTVLDGSLELTRSLDVTTVEEAIHALGLTLNEQDRVSPGLTTEIDDGDTILIERARPVTIVTATGEETVLTSARSVQSLLKELGIEPDEDDILSASDKTRLTEGFRLEITDVHTEELSEEQPIGFQTRRINDNSLAKGRERVDVAGSQGRKTVVYSVRYENGQEISREVIREEVLEAPVDRVVRVGTYVAPAPVPAPTPSPTITGGGDPNSAASWDRLAACESGGNWSINTGNGYYGGLQFHPSTWRAYGGGAYAEFPHQASREQQIAVAKVLHARRGWYPWPGCTRRFGWI